MMKQRLSLWNDRLRVALFNLIAAIAHLCQRLIEWAQVQITRARMSVVLPVRRAEGQGLVEYALILVLVAVVVIAILTVLGPQVGNVFSKVNCHLGGSVTTSQPGNSGNAGGNSPTTVVCN